MEVRPGLGLIHCDTVPSDYRSRLITFCDEEGRRKEQTVRRAGFRYDTRTEVSAVKLFRGDSRYATHALCSSLWSLTIPTYCSLQGAWYGILRGICTHTITLPLQAQGHQREIFHESRIFIFWLSLCLSVCLLSLLPLLPPRQNNKKDLPLLCQGIYRNNQDERKKTQVVFAQLLPSQFIACGLSLLVPLPLPRFSKQCLFRSLLYVP